MTLPVDFVYLDYLIARDLVAGPVLEVGSKSYQGADGNMQAFCTRHGFSWQGCDIEAGPGVDFLLDLGDRRSIDALNGRSWPTVLLFNLLEHVYNPIEVLTNAFALTSSGGLCVVCGPTVMDLHDYPRDYWRPLPDFFIEFASRNGAEIVEESCRWLALGRLFDTHAFDEASQKHLPSKNGTAAKELWGWQRSGRSRFVHRLFQTYGRDTAYVTTGLALALRRNG